MSWITLQKDEAIVLGDINPYRVTFTVTDSSEIEKELFVLRTSDDSYSHVVVSDNMGQFPNTKDAAVANGDQFYRVSTVTRAFGHKDEAIAFGTFVQTRLQFVTSDWSGQVDRPFGGNSAIVISSEAA